MPVTYTRSSSHLLAMQLKTRASCEGGLVHPAGSPPEVTFATQGSRGSMVLKLLKSAEGQPRNLSWFMVDGRTVESNNIAAEPAE